MMKRTLITLFILILPVLTFAQVMPPDSLWSTTCGGNNADYCYSIQQTTDGGYILGGSTASFTAGGYDCWLLKMDVNGDSLWSRRFGGSSHDACYSVIQASDGGYLHGGYTSSFGASSRSFWLVKVASNGDSVWSYTYGGSIDDRCYSVQQTSDGGFILAGHTTPSSISSMQVRLIKVNASGTQEWIRTFGRDNADYCQSVQQTSDGGYILGGATIQESGFEDIWLVKTNSTGDTLWTRIYGGSHNDKCYSVQQTTDGGYILGGYTYYDYTVADCWLLKTDANGDTLWTKTFGGIYESICHSVQQVADGGYILGGQTNCFGSGYWDFWLVRTDADGDSLWSRTFGESNFDEGWSAVQTTDGGYALGGYTGSYPDYDFRLVKTGTERPYHVTICADTTTGNPVVHWIAPYECDYLIYSTTNPNHDGNPPGMDWTLEITLPNVPAGPAEWEDTNAFDESYRNYIIVISCP
jgi:hypothetical protein